MNSSRRERIRIKRSIRQKMIVAAENSMDYRVFGYSIIVKDPAPAAFMDQRRKAVASVDFEEEEITITMLNQDSLEQEKFSLGSCYSKDKLKALHRLAWHPAMPIGDILEGAAIFFNLIQNGGQK